MRIYNFKVMGSNDTVYQTRLMEDGNHFYHTCSCPSSHHKKCKHVIQLLSGDTSSTVDLDRANYDKAIEAISSFKRGIHYINKARVKRGMTPLCRVCKGETQVVVTPKSWLQKLFNFESSTAVTYACPNCNGQA